METIRYLIYRLAWNALAIYLIAGIYGDRIELSGFKAAVGVVLLLALAQALIRPIIFLVRVATFPINWLTLGAVSLIAGLMLNAFAFFAIGWAHLIEGFGVKDFWAALGATFLLSIANAVGNLIFGQRG